MSGQTAPRVRIAYLTGEYPAISHTFILREIAALRDHGLDVVTCAVRRPGPQHLRGAVEAQEADRTFYIIESARRPGHVARALIDAVSRPGRLLAAMGLAWRTCPPGLRASVWQAFYVVEAMLLARHLRAVGATHLHNHFAQASCSVAMLTSALAGLPFSFTLHGPADFLEPRSWHLGEKIARARFVACISHYCRSQGMIFADPAHWSRMPIVHCGVTSARYRVAARDPGKTLLFVGRLAAVKGVAVLLTALTDVRRAHPDVRLVLVGDGPERPRIERLVDDLGLRDIVRLTGFRTQDEVAAELAAADLFVLPSFSEGVPVVLMEAMASGLPVIATQVAGVPELVDPGTAGLVVPPGDPVALTRAICALLDDPGRRVVMGAAGQRAVAAEFEIADEARWLALHLQGAAPEGQLRPDRAAAATPSGTRTP
jgi:glycosyltransferase involved in cell wall biosynthesis